MWSWYCNVIQEKLHERRHNIERKLWKRCQITLLQIGKGKLHERYHVMNVERKLWITCQKNVVWKISTALWQHSFVNENSTWFWSIFIIFIRYICVIILLLLLGLWTPLWTYLMYITQQLNKLTKGCYNVWYYSFSIFKKHINWTFCIICLICKDFSRLRIRVIYIATRNIFGQTLRQRLSQTSSVTLSSKVKWKRVLAESV